MVSAIVAMRLNSTHKLAGCFSWYVGVTECKRTAEQAVELCMCDYASDPEWQKKVDWMFM